jgi:deoxycytidylate deaminase
MRIISDPKELAFVEKTYARIAELAKTAGCHDWQCAAVIVGADGKTAGEGVNSPPSNLESERRCHANKTLLHPKVSDKSCCIHAEQRAVMDALKRNPAKLSGSTLYYCRLGKNGKLALSGEPWCTICSKMALDAGVAEFVLKKAEGYVAYATDEYNRLSFSYAP